jgi:hypothetical protein
MFFETTVQDLYESIGDTWLAKRAFIPAKSTARTDHKSQFVISIFQPFCKQLYLAQGQTPKESSDGAPEEKGTRGNRPRRILALSIALDRTLGCGLTRGQNPRTPRTLASEPNMLAVQTAERPRHESVIAFCR